MARILVTDDYKPLRELYKIGFSREGHEVYTASNGVEAYELFLDIKPDVVLTDHHMPEMNGLDLILVLRKLGYQVPVILLSGGSTYIHGFLEEIIILKKPASHKKLSLLIEALTLQENKP